MYKQLMTIFIGVVALAVIVAGCGGSDESSVTKAEFLKEGNAICAKSSKAILADFGSFAKTYEKKNKKEPGAAQQGEVSETVLIPGFQKQADELRALEAPSDDEELINEMLDTYDKGIEEGEANPEAFVNNSSPSFKAAMKTANEYGLRGCGEL